jgi:hypothetical protein
MLREYTVANMFTLNPYDGNGIVDPPAAPPVPEPASERLGHQQGAFGHLMGFFASAAAPATTIPSGTSTVPVGPPNFNRILDYVHVPSRFVGTETLLTPEVFNDSPFDGTDNLSGPNDPRHTLQPPYNKVARERDPGRVNLNTVLGRRVAPTSSTPAFVWS